MKKPDVLTWVKGNWALPSSWEALPAWGPYHVTSDQSLGFSIYLQNGKIDWNLVTRGSQVVDPRIRCGLYGAMHKAS